MERIDYIKNSSCLTLFKKQHPLFKVEGTLNPYVGCLYNCLYCPFGNTGKLGVKTDYLHLLGKKLEKAKKDVHIGLGSMIEPYNDQESEYQLTHHTLEILMRHGLPVQIFTKSSLILRDMEMLKEYAKKGLLAVSVSVFTMNHAVTRILEPQVPDPAERMHIVKELKRNEIFSGIILAPIIPFLSDSRSVFEHLFEEARRVNADYILPAPLTFDTEEHKGRTLEAIVAKYPRIKEKIETIYNDGLCPTEKYGAMVAEILKICSDKYGIPLTIPLEGESSAEPVFCQDLLK